MTSGISETIGKYHVYIHCTRVAPFCYHSRELDVPAIIAEHGDVTDDYLRRNARCQKCGHKGASLIITPVHTGPSWNHPTRKD